MIEELSLQKQLNIEISLVKKPDHLEGLDGIIFPGGESTVIKKLLISSGLDNPLSELLNSGFPVFGTCAGLIVLSEHFGVIDCKVKRNAYGTQIDSFEAEVDFKPTNTKCEVFFIRAPTITSVGDSAEVIAKHGKDTIGVCDGSAIGITCHPEVAGSFEFHDFFVGKILERVKSSS